MLAEPDDAAALASLEEQANRVALAHVFGPELPYPYDDVLARWSLVLEEPGATTLVARDGGRVEGFAAYDLASLRHLALAPELFGSGLAAQLHDEVVAAWRVAGLRQATLWVLEENHRARRFYQRRGWRPDGHRQECRWPPYPVEVGYALDLALAAPEGAP